MDAQSIDWALCIELSNNKPTLAKDILMMLLDDIETFKVTISQACEAGDAEALEQHAHKLHGGCCYCGVPHLKRISSELEIAAKTNRQEAWPRLIDAMLEEMDLIKQQFNQPAFQAQLP